MTSHDTIDDEDPDGPDEPCDHDQMTWDGRHFRCTDCPDQSGPVPGGALSFD